MKFACIFVSFFFFFSINVIFDVLEYSVIRIKCNAYFCIKSTFQLHFEI